MTRLLELAERLMLTPGISGYEGEVAAIMSSELQPFTDSVRRDKIGNVIGVIEGKDDLAPRTMLIAHMDQIGLVVTNVCENGLIRVTKNGSVPDKVMPGTQLLIRTLSGEYLPAVVAVKPHHAMSDADKSRVDAMSDIFVDMGARSRSEVNRAGVYVGCAVQYRPSFNRLMGSRISGTAIDNRMSCAVMLACAEYFYAHRPNCTVYLTATVQEEHNLRGGMVAAKSIKPDAALCLDVSLDSTQPGLEGLLDNAIGTGPTMGMYSFHGRGTLNGTIAHEGLSKLAQAVADQAGIHLNRFAMRGILSDSTYIQLENDEGVACLDLGFPARYIHSPAELCDMSDVEGLYTLVCNMVGQMSRDFDCSRF